MELKQHFLPYGEETRLVRVLLPKNYAQTNKKYPVIYFHDGQNIFFDHESYIHYSWRVMQTLKKMNLDVIVVAINTSENRMHEMAPFKLIKDYEFDNDLSLSAQYEAFCVGIVVPFIQKNYRIKKHPKFTAMIGSSLGGCFTQYLGMKYPQIFGCLGIFSSANFIFEDEFYKYFEEYKNKNQKFYIQVGGNEGSKWDKLKHQDQLYLDASVRFYTELIRKKVPLNQVVLKVIANGKHSEKTWAKCLFDCFVFLKENWK